MIGVISFLFITEFSIDDEIATRLERKSFFLTVGKAKAKKDWEWKTEKVAIKK